MTATDSLVQACRELAAAGLSPGSSGNVSVRDGERILITPTGWSLRRMTPEAVSVLSSEGRHVGGPPPTKEAPMHLAAYRSRPDARAVVHLHSHAATALSCLGSDGSDPLPAYTPYRIRSLGTVTLAPYAPPGSDALADEVAAAAVASHVVLLANHGSLVCATDLARAVDLCEELEAAAELALALHGLPARTLDAETAWG